MSKSIMTLDEPFEVWGSGFEPGESVTILFAVDQFVQSVLGEATANAAGGFRASFDKVQFRNEATRKRVVEGEVYSILAQGSAKTKASAPVLIVGAPVVEPAPGASLVAAATTPGSETTIWGAGFKANESVSVILVGADGQESILVGGFAGDGGAITMQAIVNLDPGLYTLRAEGNMGSVASAPLLVLEEK